MSIVKYQISHAGSREGQSRSRMMSYTPAFASKPRSHGKGSYTSPYGQANRAEIRPTRPSDRGGRFVDYNRGYGAPSVATSRSSGNRSYEASEVNRGRSRHRGSDNAGALQRYQPLTRETLDEEGYDECDDLVLPDDSISMVSSRRPAARSTYSKHGSVLETESAFCKNTEPYYIRSTQEWVQVKKVRPTWS